MLQQQQLTLQLYGGLREELNAKLVQQGSLLTIENARLDKLGKIAKRYGHSLLGKTIQGTGKQGSDWPAWETTTIASGRKLAIYGDELLLMDGSKLYSYDENEDYWWYKGLIAPCKVSQRTVYSNKGVAAGSLYRKYSAATSNDVVVCTYGTASSIRATVFNKTTRERYLDHEEIATPTGGADDTRNRQFCISNGDNVYVFYTNGSDLKVRSMDTSSDTTAFSSESTVVSSGATIYDVTVHGSDLVLAYINGTDIELTYLKTDGTPGGTVDSLPADATSFAHSVTIANSISVSSYYTNTSSDRIYISFYDTATDSGKLAIRETDLTSFTSTKNISAPGSPTVRATGSYPNVLTTVDETNAWVYVVIGSIDDADDTFFTYIDVFDSDGGSGTDVPSGYNGSDNFAMANALPVADPWVDSKGNFYVMYQTSSTNPENEIANSRFVPRYFVYCHRTGSSGSGTVVAQFGVDVAVDVSNVTAANAYHDQGSAFQVPAVLGTDKYGILYQELIGTDVYSIKMVELDFASASVLSTVEVDNVLYIAAGDIKGFDGSSVYEHNMYVHPVLSDVNPNTGSGSIDAGTYSYVAIYEWRDRFGNIHRSTPSVVKTVTNSGSSEENTAKVEFLGETQKHKNGISTSYYFDRDVLRVVLYRTTAGGTVYYRAQEYTGINVDENNIVDIVDEESDANLEDNEILYTVGGVLEQVYPKPTSSITSYRNRLIGLSPSINEVQVSKIKETNIAVEFNDLLSFKVSAGSDDFTSVASMDEKLILFKQQSIHLQVGNGPNNQGGQSDFQEPLLVSSDVGCIAQNTIKLIPSGLIFKSEKGFYILSRSLELSFVGKDVVSFNDSTVSGSALDAKNNEVYYTHNDNKTLIYDYKDNIWHVSDLENKVDVAVWKDKICYLSTNGDVLLQDSTLFQDNGADYALTVGTPWYSLNGLSGFKRVYEATILGEYKSDHTLTVKIYYDFDETVAETLTVTPASGDDYLYQFKPARQKCTSIRFDIIDANDSGTNEGLTLTSIRLRVGVKSGQYPLKVGQRMT